MRNSFAAKLILSVAVGLFCGCLTSVVSIAAESIQRTSASTKSDSSPCKGVIQTIAEHIKNKADLERAITKQLNASHPALKITSVSVLRSFASGNWSIIYVQPHKLERVFFFYAGNPLTSRYVTEFSDMVMAMIHGEPAMKDWVLKNAPGIPPKLANCFVWYVTQGS